MQLQTDASLLSHNTFGVDARCDALLAYDSEDELPRALELCRRRFPSLPLLHIGGGSNLLFLGDYHGVVLLSRIRHTRVTGERGDDVYVRVGAGVVHDDLVARAVASGWHGLENLSLIPGQVGASAVQNIGAYGVEAADVIESVEGVSLLTGERRVWSAAECGYAYRSSVFKTALRGRYAVTAVTYRLSRRFVPRLDYGGLRRALEERGLEAASLSAGDLRRLVIDIRRAKLPDPRELGNAGSFFMNPVVWRGVYERILASHPGAPCYEAGEGLVKIPAAWLIEQCGWKGRSLGPAAVHDRQALVLVNRGGATGRDILALCEAVRADVRREFGVELRPEVNLIPAP